MDTETRELFREVAEALDALLIALQTELRGGDWDPEPGYALREAIQRINRYREHVAGPEVRPRPRARLEN